MGRGAGVTGVGFTSGGSPLLLGLVSGLVQRASALVLQSGAVVGWHTSIFQSDVAPVSDDGLLSACVLFVVNLVTRAAGDDAQ